MAFDIFNTVEEEDFPAEEMDNGSVLEITRHFKENINVSDFKHTKFCVGDVININILAYTLPFRVEHITEDGRVYFVATKIVCHKAMENIDDVLEELFHDLPKDLTEIMEFVEHLTVIKGTDQKVESKRKLTIPSYNNVSGSRVETTKDDMQFVGFCATRNRIRDDGSTDCAWWTDSTTLNMQSRYMYVSETGKVCSYAFDDDHLGIVLMFCIKSDACICENKEASFQ